MMQRTRLVVLAASTVALLWLAATGPSAQGQQPPSVPDPLVRVNLLYKLTDHVFVIPDKDVPLVPNVGIIAGPGTRGTLVVDTGLGPNNGRAVLNAMSIAASPRVLYVMSTHFHPEHALGESAFPATATLIRARAQQQDIDEFGLTLAQNFSRRSQLTADLLKDAQYRKADRLFDNEETLDLGGGVTARLMALGPAHTRGDTVVYVQPDGVLFAGDIVMNRFLAFASPTSGIATWIRALDALKALTITTIVPSHGPLGDAALIDKNRAYLVSLQARVSELKKQKRNVDDIVATVTKEFQEKYPEWTNVAAIGPAARAAFTEAQ
jgi:glyoxylase-like metal-dependent hydrolase (beta-lactamase superfamily II)